MLSTQRYSPARLFDSTRCEILSKIFEKRDTKASHLLKVASCGKEQNIRIVRFPVFTAVSVKMIDCLLGCYV